MISGFYRPTGLVGDMGGGSLEVVEVIDDRVGERSVSLPLGALPVQSLLAQARGQGQGPRRQAAEGAAAAEPDSVPVFHAVGGGWRALAKVHMANVDAPVRVVHGYTLKAAKARTFTSKLWRMPEAKLAKLPGVPSRRVPTLQGGGPGPGPGAQAAGAGAGGVLGPGRARGLALHPAPMPRSAISTHWSRGRRCCGVPLARVAGFAPALTRWTDDLFPGETASERRLRVAACALSDIAWRDHADLQGLESFRRLLQFPFIGIDHTERVFLAAAIHARYPGRPNDPRLEPAIGLLRPTARRRAQILGRTMLLGYRISGSVPEILEGARLRIDTDGLHLEVGRSARVPDSEVVADRLTLLASAVGVRRTEIVEAAEPA